MYVSAFMTAIYAGSNSQSFMVKFSKFSGCTCQDMQFSHSTGESFSFCAAAQSLTVELLQIKKKTRCEVHISMYLFY